MRKPASKRKFVQKPLRRNPKVPKIVYTKAEDIPGYEKFTLDEVIFPDQKVCAHLCGTVHWYMYTEFELMPS